MTRTQLEHLQETDVIAFHKIVEDFDPYVTKDNYEDVLEQLFNEADRFVQYSDGTYGRVDNFGILRDVDPVNTLIANEKTAIESAAANVACVGMLMFVLTIFSLAVILPDHMEGRVSDDAPATWRAE